MRKLLNLLSALALALVMIAITGIAGAQSSWYGQGANPNFAHDVSVGGNLSVGGDLNNSGDAVVAGDLSVTGSISAGGGTIASGVFGQDLAMGAGYDFTVEAGDTAFDWSLGTGDYKTTTGNATLGGGRNPITMNGPVLGIDGAGWTMVGASMFTLGSTGMMADGGTITFLNATSGTAGTFSGTVTAEQVTSTDDMIVTDDLNVLGKADISETLTAEHLASTDDGVIADDLDVVGDLTAGTMASDAGITAVTTVQAEQLTSTDDITATDDINAHDAVITGDVGTATVTASGQVRAEDLYSTDDGYIHDDFFVDGTSTLQDVSVNTTLTAGGRVKAEDLYSTDDAYIHDDFAVDGTATVDVLTVNTTSDFNGAMTTRGITLDADSGIGMSGTATLSGVTGTFTARVQAEDLKSTDDAYIKDAFFTDGTSTLNAGVINTTLDVNGATTTRGITLDSGYNISMSGAAATLTGVTGTFSGTVTGEQLTSTDDAKITDALEVDGSSALNGTTIAATKTLAVTTADKLTVGSVIVPQYWDFNVQTSATSVDGNVFVPTSSWKIVSVKEVHSVAATGNPTLTVRKCTGTQAPSAGAGMLAAAFNLSTTAETIVSGTPNTDGSQKINSTERLAFDYSAATTALAGGVVTIRLQRI